MDFLKNFKTHTVLFFAGLVFIAWSCGEVLNTDDYDIKAIEASPTLALPLAYGNLSIQDVLGKADSANIKVYPDGLVYIQYDETLKTQNVRELVEIPDKSNVTKTLNVPAGVLPPVPNDVNSTQVSQVVFFDVNPEELTEVLFDNGLISYNLTVTPPNPNFRYAINIAIPEFVTNVGNVPFSKELPPTGPAISLAGYKYSTPVPNRLTIIFTLVLKQNPNPVIIPPGTTVVADLSFTGMNYTYAKGFFGDQTTASLEETIGLDAFKNALTSGTNISFFQPKLEFTVINSVGVPTKVYFSALEARKPGSSFPVQITPASPITINSPTTLGTTATTVVTVNNVNDILSFAPTQLYYKFVAHINEGLFSGENFVADTSSLRVALHIEIPLYGHASNVLLSDTLALDLSDVDQSTIESAALKIKAINEIPLEAFIQFYLTTSTYQVIDSLLAPNQTQLIKASQVDANGELKTPGTNDDLISINKDKLNKIFQAKKIIIKARMNTSNANGTFPDVKFKAQQKIDVKLGLQAKLKINVTL